METELIRQNGANEADSATTLSELSRKIDALAAQVQYLTEQAQVAERERQARAELMHDLTPILNDAFRLSVTQLEEVQDYVQPEELLRLFKKFLRHARQLEALLDQLDALYDLLETLTPVSKDIMVRLTEALQTLDEKGYFAFARGGVRIIDNIVTSFNEDDVNRLGDNIALILNTVKDMTQPEILAFVRNTLLLAEQEVGKPVDTSLFSLLRQLQDPAVRRGLALTLRVLQVIGHQANTNSKSVPAQG
jgi:uncharacterized protein YjgD (DUF1641 family)